MGKCCSKSKPQVHQEIQEPDTQEVLLEVDPGGGATKMTGETLLVSSPGRWGSHTSKGSALIPTQARCGGGPRKPLGKPVIASNLGARQTPSSGGRGKAGNKTFQLSSGGGQGVAVQGVKGGRFITTCQAFVSGTTQRPNNLNYETNRRSSLTVTSTPKGKRMAKTKTETTVRTYTKNGKRYEETTVVDTKEEDNGTITKTTKTTTKILDDAFSTKALSSAIEGAKTRSGGRKSSSSSSSSSDSSPTRVKAQKPKTNEEKKKKDESKKKEEPKKEEPKKVKPAAEIKTEKVKPAAEKKTEKVKPVESKPEKSGGLLRKLKAAATASSDDSSDEDEDFVKSVHKNVNEYRVKHGVAKLKLSKELNKYAKLWAKKLAADDKMVHNPDTRYGENIYCLSSNTTNFDVNSKDVVDKWYSEIKDHKFGEEPKGTTLKTGHFTQLVWKDTKQMGVAKARSAAGTKLFVVANFDPQGNWMGQFADQVPPVGGFPKSAEKRSIFNRTRKSSSSSSSDSESSSDEEDFADDCLKAHNTYRAKHGAAPLKLSKRLNKYAKDWAETLAKKDTMQHRQNNDYGENLYCGYSSDPKFKLKGDVAVKSWYEEIKDFKFGMEPSDLRAGHFTQVVWADSKELGVAYCKSKSGKVYVVANYSPAGNFVGSFASKVPRVK